MISNDTTEKVFTGVIFIIIFSINNLAYADSVSDTLTEGTQTAWYCCTMPFSIKMNHTTKGFDPMFLSLLEVKQTCINSHKDLQKAGLQDLKYCSKELGTL